MKLRQWVEYGSKNTLESILVKKLFFKNFFSNFENPKFGFFIQFREATSGRAREPEVGLNES